MSIKATTLSDICTAEGRTITNQAWTLVDSNNLREDYDWPRQPNEFSPNQISIWQRALAKTFIREYEPNSRKLKIPFILGDWICPLVKNKWKWFYSNHEDSLYLKESTEWRRFRKIPTRTRTERFVPTNERYSDLPATATRLATIYEKPQWIVKEHA